MPEVYTTSQAARMLGLPSYFALYGLLRKGAVAPPMKNGSGDFLWERADIERVRAYLESGQAVEFRGRRAATTPA